MGDQVVNVTCCQRCGSDHELTFKALLNATDDYNMWSLCPRTNQPLLLKVVYTTDGQK